MGKRKDYVIPSTTIKKQGQNNQKGIMAVVDRVEEVLAEKEVDFWRTAKTQKIPF
jgi:hypothetical protein